MVDSRSEQSLGFDISTKLKGPVAEWINARVIGYDTVGNFSRATEQNYLPKVDVKDPEENLNKK